MITKTNRHSRVAALTALCDYSPHFPYRSWLLTFVAHMGVLVTFMCMYSLAYPVPGLPSVSRAIFFLAFCVSGGIWLGQKRKWQRAHPLKTRNVLTQEALDAIAQTKEHKGVQA